MTRDEILAAVSKHYGLPARWYPGPFGFDGCERTIQVYEADLRRSLELLRSLRPLRPQLEQAAGGPILVMFHKGVMPSGV